MRDFTSAQFDCRSRAAIDSSPLPNVMHLTRRCGAFL
jgi:hypothetical protein